MVVTHALGALIFGIDDRGPFHVNSESKKPQVEKPRVEKSQRANDTVLGPQSVKDQAPNACETISLCSFWWTLYEPVAGLAEASRPT